ncbi:MAG: DUF2306 domain-containing protein [Pseudomonadota bacterium]
MNLTPLLEASLAIQIHVACAVVSFFLGAWVLWRKKGTARHRQLGKIWVAAMLGVSFTGFFIHEIDGFDFFSPIHLFSVTVPLSMALAIWYARKGRLTEHRRTMQGTYLGSMVVAGGFTFLPGRLNHDVFFGGSAVDLFETDYGWMFIFAGVVLVSLILTWIERRTKRADG